MPWREQLVALWRGLLALVAPGPCPGCGGAVPGGTDTGFCPRCWVEAAPLRGGACRRCTLPLPDPRATECPDCRSLGASPALELALAAVRYERSAVSLHRELKFGEAIELTGPIATRMAIVWRHRGPFRPDLLVPIPPDPLRIGPRRRTPWRLARAVSRELGAPCRRALRKPRSTRAQTGRSASTRRTALGGAFSADLRLVAGRRVVLIDDVCTTGGTLEAAAAALRDAGAERIAALVWARTPLPADRRGRFRDLGRDGREPAATI